jgi:hypothetical protein
VTTALQIEAVDPVVETLEISAIDRSVQIRIKTDRGTVEDYQRALVAGAVFPPVVVFREKKTGTLFLSDGNHRLESRLLNGDTTIEAIVHDGGKRAALAHGLGSSKGHGLRFSNACKRNAVLLALKDSKLTKLKDQDIADLIGVSQPFVWKLRSSITVIKSAPAEAPADAPEQSEPAPEPDACERAVSKFKRLLRDVSDDDRVRFGEAVLALLT